ncbi:MAG: hypothetical protein COT74_03515 [Bdellovibrionales bacterium CG10_big_fil_rev_8_21_14_0_10_45_34]|nr:MAG: hypothetical protein COT74_03515 [Bdellovibrionales bacterium CG10_big_fil_rev_8_21_14_0_10_45_34]
MRQISNDLGRATEKESLTSGGVWAFFGRFSNIAAVVIINALSARILSTSEMGSLFLAISLNWVLGLTIQFGLNHMCLKIVSESSARNDAPAITRTLYISTALILLGSFAFALLSLSDLSRYFLGSLISSDLIPANLTLICLWASLNAYQLVLAEFWRGLRIESLQNDTEGVGV